ncbi:hypothetical protein K2X30_13145 [bacterium]|nr:hypothetical protein [bacterium]
MICRLLLISIFFSSCATVRGSQRILFGAGVGAVAGAGGGAALSPNDESRGLNALVFGLSGALVGGVVALLTDHKEDVKKAEPALNGQDNAVSLKYQVLPEDRLPSFVRDRLQPTVIEEYVQPDVVTEEGVLHEPHKVYRIKRLPELYSKPNHEVFSAQEPAEKSAK